MTLIAENILLVLERNVTDRRRQRSWAQRIAAGHASEWLGTHAGSFDGLHLKKRLQNVRPGSCDGDITSFTLILAYPT